MNSNVSKCFSPFEQRFSWTKTCPHCSEEFSCSKTPRRWRRRCFHGQKQPGGGGGGGRRCFHVFLLQISWKHLLPEEESVGKSQVGRRRSFHTPIWMTKTWPCFCPPFWQSNNGENKPCGPIWEEEEEEEREGQTLFVRCEYSQTRGEFVSTHKLAVSQKVLTRSGKKKAFMKSWFLQIVCWWNHLTYHSVSHTRSCYFYAVFMYLLSDRCFKRNFLLLMLLVSLFKIHILNFRNFCSLEDSSQRWYQRKSSLGGLVVTESKISSIRLS